MLILLIVLWLAFMLDLLIGDPPYRWHPVRLIGHLISALEAKIYQNTKTAGLWLLLLTSSVILALVLLVFVIFQDSLFILSAVSIFLLYSVIGFKDLLSHAQPIYQAVRNQQLTKAQNAVQMIVGRDAKQLDLSGVVRATIESLAENSVDGLLAVLFYFCVGGVLASWFGASDAVVLLVATLAALIYRLANTLDAMVGYQNERYAQFGWASAKFDDVLNFIPARLSVLFFLVAAWLLRLLTANAWQTVKRDRLKHKSPNAGHPEAVVAGALGIRLGGATVYKHGTVDKPWLGDGRAELNGEDIKRTERLVLLTGIIYVLTLGLLIAVL